MAKARVGGSKAAVEPETIEIPAANDLEKLRRYHAELGDIIARMSPSHSGLDRVSYHVRRHFPLYALAAVFALVLVLIPSRNNGISPTGAEAITDNTSSSTDSFGSSDTSKSGSSGTSVLGTSSTRNPNAGGLGGAPTATTPANVGKVATASGTTIGGYECKQGVRQVPWSQYANPCVAKFAGNNGGKTYRGVDAKTIRIAVRQPSVDAGDVTDQQAAAQGAATRASGVAMFKKYDTWMSKVFDLYGRHIEWVDFHSKVSNGVDEAQSKGEDGACADATDLQSLNVFGVVGYNGGLTETQPFADCAAARGLFVPFGASYFPEKYYTEKWDPYVWHTLQECERIARDVGEYAGKRLAGRPAKWALDPVYKKTTRVFGTYVPDNDGYQRCVNISESVLKNQYHTQVKSRFNYKLDVAQFPQQAEQGVLQFKADGVTTLINACDTLSTRFLTDAASRQKWGPEWFIIGVATQDTDGAARTFNKSIVDGHLFGMSQLGATRLIEGKDGESYRSWKTAFPNEAPPAGFGAVYYRALALHMMLQSAGPILTPKNIAAGLRALPDGGGDHGAQGTWSFKGDHTAIDDSREIYWKQSAKGFDGSDGGYVEANGGKRYKSGQWPTSEPAIYK